MSYNQANQIRGTKMSITAIALSIGLALWETPTSADPLLPLPMPINAPSCTRDNALSNQERHAILDAECKRHGFSSAALAPAYFADISSDDGVIPLCYAIDAECLDVIDSGLVDKQKTSRKTAIQKIITQLEKANYSEMTVVKRQQVREVNEYLVTLEPTKPVSFSLDGGGYIDLVIPELQASSNHALTRWIQRQYSPIVNDETCSEFDQKQTVQLLVRGGEAPWAQWLTGTLPGHTHSVMIKFDSFDFNMAGISPEKKLLLIGSGRAGATAMMKIVRHVTKLSTPLDTKPVFISARKEALDRPLTGASGYTELKSRFNEIHAITSSSKDTTGGWHDGCGRIDKNTIIAALKLLGNPDPGQVIVFISAVTPMTNDIKRLLQEKEINDIRTATWPDANKWF